MTIYTENGIVNARTYHGVCSVCKAVHYHGYVHDKQSNIRNYDLNAANYLFTTSKIGFSKKFLQEATYQIFIGSVSFQSTAEIYNYKFDLIQREEKLNPDRLEDSWFIYQIIKFNSKIIWYREKDVLDVERICQSVYKSISNEIDTKWRAHICDDEGCKNR